MRLLKIRGRNTPQKGGWGIGLKILVDGNRSYSITRIKMGDDNKIPQSAVKRVLQTS